MLEFTDTGIYEGEGEIIIGGDFLNFSQQNFDFDMTLTDRSRRLPSTASVSTPTDRCRCASKC